ncbi:hypothetical protein Cfor_05045 [Coptotermes formosanus]|uniref:Ionotropic glutamate receptor L-glutamate and glycine-binding domain-containing protein n=1 Tax=Coptotermes formosanus TaxID=36987 RepID=A0A6L2PHV3_COPFO|nr:hypothetical protein Cfor_05045 [Coptotermes formosanus]
MLVMYHLISVTLILTICHQNRLTAAENYLSRIERSWISLDVSSDFCSWHNFWNISPRHFYAARTVFIIVLSSSGIRLQTENLAKLLTGINNILNIPIILFDDTVGSSAYDVRRNMFLSDVRFNSSYAFLIVSEHVSGVFKYTETSVRLWRRDVSLLILIIQRESGHSSDKTLLNVQYSDLFKNLWIQHQTNKVFLFVKLFNKCQDEIWYYDPFVEGNDSERGQVYKLKFTGAIDRYFLKGVSNLRGYSLHVSMFPSPITAIEEVVNNTEYNSSSKYRGRDGLVLKELAKHMNFTPNMVRPDSNNSFEFSDGSLTGPLKYIANGDVDIAMNSVFMKVFHSVDIEYVTPVTHFGKICVLVPRAPKIPVWMLLFRCLSVTLWTTLIGTYIVSTICWHMLTKRSFIRQSHRDVHWATSLTDVLNIFMPTCFAKIFSLRNQSERIFVASCMFSSIVITSAWQGALFDRLKNPIYYKDIDTLEELDESGLPIFTMEEILYDIFDRIDTPTTRQLSKRFRVTNFPHSFDLIQQLADHRNFALLLSLIEIETLLDTYPINTHLLHCVQECPMIYFSSYMVPRGSSYLKDINTIVGRLFEGGLIRKWYYDAIYETCLPIRLRSANRGIGDFKQKRFSLNDLLIAFMVLIFGLGLGALVLLMEFFLCKCQHLARRIM